MVALFGAVVTGFFFVSLGVAVQLINIGFGLWFSEAFIFFAVPFLSLRVAGYDAFRAAGVGRPWLKGAALGLAVGLVNFFAVVVPLQVVSQKLAPKELIELFDISGIFKHQTPLELVSVVLGVCLAAPFCEEFCFRGLIQRGAATRLGEGRAVVLTAVVFSAFHMDPIGFLARVELGLLFGVLALRSGSIWPGAFAHLANNAVSTALYFASTQAGSTDDDLPWWAPVAMAGAGIPLLVALATVAKRRPEVLVPAWRAEQRPKSVRVHQLVLQWAVAAAVAVALLLAIDPSGVKLNLFDAFHSLKEPKKTEGAQAQRQWDLLWELRAEARHDPAKIEAYQEARKRAISDRSAR